MISRARLGVGALGSGLYQATDWLSGKLSPGQSGLLGFGGRYREDVAMMNLGAVSGSMSMDAWAEYDARKSVAMPDEAVLPGLGHRSAGAWAGGALFGAWGAKTGIAMAAGFGLATGGLGLLAIGGVAAAGAVGGALLGGEIGGMFGSDPKLTGATLQGYNKTFAASTTARADVSKVTDAMLSSKSFRELSAQLDRSGLSPENSLATQALISASARESGATEEDVISGFMGRGGTLGLEKPVQTFGDLGKGSDLIANLLKGEMDKTGFSAASPEFSMAASTYVKAYRDSNRTGNTRALVNAEAGLERIGIRGAALQSFRENVAKQTTSTLESTATALDAQTAMGTSANAKVAMEAMRKDVMSSVGRLKGTGGMSSQFFDWLEKAKPDEFGKTLFGSGENRSSLLEAMRQAGGFEDAVSLQTGGFDFLKGSAHEATMKFHLSGEESKWLQQARDKGMSAETIRNTLTARKLGMGTEQAAPEKEANMRIQALQAMTDTMTLAAKRLTGEKV